MTTIEKIQQAITTTRLLMVSTTDSKDHGFSSYLRGRESALVEILESITEGSPISIETEER